MVIKSLSDADQARTSLRLSHGVEVVESPESLRITANPISPSQVPGHLYALSVGLAIGDPVLSILILTVCFGTVNVLLYQMLMLLIIVGQMLAVSLAALTLASWIRSISCTQYEITICRSEVIIIRKSNGVSETLQIRRSDIRSVRSSTVVGVGEVDEGVAPTDRSIRRLEIVTNDGECAEYFCGRPNGVTQVVLSRTCRVLGVEQWAPTPPVIV